jgi:hypothetical protein
MAITTLDGWVASAKSYLSLMKSASRTTVAASWFSTFDLAGNPGAGVLAGTSTASGVVPTASTVGTPNINAFGGGNTGYLSQVDFGNTVPCRMKLFDMLFKAGAYAFSAGTTTLTTQPSYSSRVPSGTNYGDTQLWIEVSTAFATGTAWQVQVTYTNQSGTAAQSSIILPATTAANLTQGRMYQLALAAGDTGLQKVESVIVTNGGTAMTAGAFNVLVVHPIWSGRVKNSNDGDIHGLDKTAMPVVYATSAITLVVNADSTSTGVPELEFVISNG